MHHSRTSSTATDRKSWFSITDIDTRRRKPIGANSFNFYCSMGLRSVADESSSERKEAEKFDFELWPQASKFGSLKVSLRRRSNIKINSSSMNPRVVSNNWLRCQHGGIGACRVRVRHNTKWSWRLLIQILCESSHWRLSSRAQEYDHFLRRGLSTKTSVQCL